MANMAQLPIRRKGHSKCIVHRDNDVVFVCQKCNLLICTTCCLSENHKDHIDSLRELSETRTENTNRIVDFVNDAENINIPKLNQEIISSRTKMSGYKTHYENLRKSIIDNNNQCKSHLDQLTAEYISTCDQMEAAETDIIQTHIPDLERRLDTLRNLLPEYKQTLQTGTDVLMYDSVSEIREMDPDSPPTPSIEMVEFTPSKDRQSLLKQAVGNINIPDNLLQYSLPDHPTVMSEFTYPEIITSICPTSDGRAWLCDCTNDTVKLISNNGLVIQKIQYNSKIFDISLDPTSGRLWFCSYWERTICEASTSSTPVCMFTTEDRPANLCVTREGRVVVGTRGIHDKVVMYTADGQMLHTAIVEGSWTGAVESITQCGVTGNIAVVVDYKRIIVYNPTLQPLVHYRGEGIQAQGEGIQSGEPVTPDKFGPRTVVYDSKGNIIIADGTRNTIELISGAGKYIKTLHTNTGYQGPVGIQKGDKLWSRLRLDTGEWGLKLLKHYSD
ncbi:uncharacterized protein LOC117335329 [Pecten maximus]|uniref:uncharacterized protein LOC117335329 n=1 Tax=Pecten maximus TaxID=6579 RepID=UPI001457FFF8|nr:uncharacterized protein LOC117335329 [Pecten maximus]